LKLSGSSKQFKYTILPFTKSTMSPMKLLLYCALISFLLGTTHASSSSASDESSSSDGTESVEPVYTGTDPDCIKHAGHKMGKYCKGQTTARPIPTDQQTAHPTALPTPEPTPRPTPNPVLQRGSASSDSAETNANEVDSAQLTHTASASNMFSGTRLVIFLIMGIICILSAAFIVKVCCFQRAPFNEGHMAVKRTDDEEDEDEDEEDFMQQEEGDGVQIMMTNSCTTNRNTVQQV